MVGSYIGDFKYLTEWDPAIDIHRSPQKVVVSCFIQNSNKFLVLQRARKDAQHKLWGIPGGKLEQSEPPIEGLKRELLEETSFSFNDNQFTLLGTALSQTPSDGQYGLYVFHTTLPPNFYLKIDLNEHYTYRWVTIEEFEDLDLLTAQREAYLLVKDQINALIGVKQKPLQETIC